LKFGHKASYTAHQQPRWLVLVGATAAFALLSAFVASPRTALFWYIFPLFGLGACYLVQFRAEFPPRWKLAFAASAVLSAVALALEWPFSGHVLWNVLFIGHAWTTAKRHSAWMALLLVSLVYLIAMKLAFQTSRDVAGAGISIAVAAIALFALADRHSAAPAGSD
jgi:FtsH-binding integral membrane protein